MSKEPTQSAGRADILAAALHEFADHGFTGATTAGIARRAGVTQPLVHHHFGSKQGLWSAVLTQFYQDLTAALEHTIQQVEAEGVDRRTRLARLLHSLMAFFGRRPELSRLLRVESSASGAMAEEIHTRWVSKQVELFRRELAAAMEDGTLPPVDPRMAYPLIIGACIQPFSEPETIRLAFGLDMHHPVNVEQYANFAVDVLLRGLGVPPEPPRPPRTRRR
ncbi:TetR family transcriptional regulator [Cystobacter fuscus]|uniref:TetR family transcriptional regulator n=1 Tax=Cystobacter fuscus TaxID=43 RepID=A0A250J3Q7_9BACT|nr:TetR/AcrR family transcriptional regulator [Cystobacter fuscus]ATB38011.1 TetR family transcriptional regulator [Cystobacter fuscus]